MKGHLHLSHQSEEIRKTGLFSFNRTMDTLKYLEDADFDIDLTAEQEAEAAEIEEMAAVSETLRLLASMPSVPTTPVVIVSAEPKAATGCGKRRSREAQRASSRPPVGGQLKELQGRC